MHRPFNDQEKWRKGDDVIAQFLATSDWRECLAGEIQLVMQLDSTDDLLVEDHQRK